MKTVSYIFTVTQLEKSYDLVIVMYFPHSPSGTFFAGRVVS